MGVLVVVALEAATSAAVVKARRAEEKEVAKEAVKVTKSAGSSSKQEHAAMVTVAGLSTHRDDSSVHLSRGCMLLNLLTLLSIMLVLSVEEHMYSTRDA